MSRTLLVADDSVTIQKVVELTFSESEFDVVAVGTGRQALEAVESHAPAVVLCDVIMPELNGYEVCDRIRSDPRTAGTPVLLLTGAFEPFDEARAEKCGANGHLTKPFESRTLLERVQALLAAAPPEAAEPAGAPPLGDLFAEEPSPSPASAEGEESFGDVDDWLREETPAVPQPAPVAEPTAAAALDEPFDEDTLEEPRGSTATSADPFSLDDGEPAVTPLAAAAVVPETPAQAAVSQVVALSSDAMARALSDPDLRDAALAAIEKVARDVVREVAWEVVPDLTASIIGEAAREGGDKS